LFGQITPIRPARRDSVCASAEKPRRGNEDRAIAGLRVVDA